jgi:hypothetical protein
MLYKGDTLYDLSTLNAQAGAGKKCEEYALYKPEIYTI